MKIECAFAMELEVHTQQKTELNLEVQDGCGNEEEVEYEGDVEVRNGHRSD